MARKLNRYERYKRAERLIRSLTKKGYSANQIQKELQKRGLGIRRKNMLKMIRKYRRTFKKPRVEKHIPRKYRPRVAWRKRAVKRPPSVYMPKAIAVYGTVDGESRRIEMHGTGKGLYQAMLLVGKRPPKKRFVQTSANKVILFPREILDFNEEWDEHPEVVS